MCQKECQCIIIIIITIIIIAVAKKGLDKKRFLSQEPLMLVVLLSKHTHFGVLRSPLTLPSDSDGLFCVSSGTSTVSLLTKTSVNWFIGTQKNKSENKFNREAFCFEIWLMQKLWMRPGISYITGCLRMPEVLRVNSCWWNGGLGGVKGWTEVPWRGYCSLFQS